MAKRLGYALSLLVLVASAVYVFVYLYRWEWNRAIIAGIFMIASGVAVGVTMILDRMTRIEQRIDALARSPEPADRIRAARPEPARPFAWLSDPEQMNVFVPVLMGAGIVVSALAWVVERIAMVSLRPSMEHGLAASLGPLSLPSGGLMEQPVGSELRSHRRSSWKGPLIAALSLALVWGGIDVLGDLTQGRPDLHNSGAASEIVLDVRFDDADLKSPIMAVEGLWGACRSTLNKDLQGPPVIDRLGSLVRIFVRPGLGEHSKRRLVGCLEDSLIDHVQGRVVSIQNFSR